MPKPRTLLSGQVPEERGQGHLCRPFLATREVSAVVLAPEQAILEKRQEEEDCFPPTPQPLAEVTLPGKQEAEKRQGHLFHRVSSASLGKLGIEVDATSNKKVGSSSHVQIHPAIRPTDVC